MNRCCILHTIEEREGVGFKGRGWFAFAWPFVCTVHKRRDERHRTALDANKWMALVLPRSRVAHGHIVSGMV